MSTLSILRVVCTSLADLARRKLLGGPPVYVRACSEPGELGALGVKGGPKDFAIAAANAPCVPDRDAGEDEADGDAANGKTGSKRRLSGT